jgi:hypothetical protein
VNYLFVAFSSFTCRIIEDNKGNLEHLDSESEVNRRNFEITASIVRIGTFGWTLKGMEYDKTKGFNIAADSFYYRISIHHSVTSCFSHSNFYSSWV